MADVRDNLQLDDFSSQQSQCPFSVTFRRRAKSHGDNLSFFIAGEQLFGSSPGSRFAIKRVLKTAFDEPLTNVLHRLGTTRKGLGNLRVCPSWPIGIGLKQYLSPPNLLCRSFELASNLATNLAFLLHRLECRQKFPARRSTPLAAQAGFIPSNHAANYASMFL